MAAIHGNDLREVDRLIAQGTSVHGQTIGGVTPVRAALMNSDVDILERLLEAGANPEGCAFECALREGKLDHAVALVAHGADPRWADRDETPLKTPLLHRLIEDEFRADADALTSVATLLRHGVGIESRGMYGETPLMVAAANYRPAVVECLLAHGADIHARDDNGCSALLYAANSETITYSQGLGFPCTQILAAHGACREDRDNNGNGIPEAARRFLTALDERATLSARVRHDTETENDNGVSFSL